MCAFPYDVARETLRLEYGKFSVHWQVSSYHFTATISLYSIYFLIDCEHSLFSRMTIGVASDLAINQTPDLTRGVELLLVSAISNLQRLQSPASHYLLFALTPSRARDQIASQNPIPYLLK